jgi:hypothetical protein
MDSVGTVLVAQLLPQAPLLLAYLTAVLLAVTFWQRCPTPALLTLIAAGLLLVVAVGQTFFNFYIIEARDNLGGGQTRIGWLFAAVGIISSLLWTLAFGLLLGAVFHGRRREQRPSEDE